MKEVQMNIIRGRSMLGPILMLCGLILFSGAQRYDASALEPMEEDPAADGPFQVLQTDYDLGDEAFHPPAYPDDIRVEVRARVFFPADLSQGPYPLIVFLHGYFYTCHNGTLGSNDWPCWRSGTGYVRMPNNEGYDYIAANLASHGYIVASISSNGILAQDQVLIAQSMEARAQLIRYHLDLWNTWSTTGGFPCGNDPNRFIGKVDMQDIGLMGHSRGGEGVVKYVELYGSIYPYHIKGVFPLAPTDGFRAQILGVPFAVLLPYCDGDVQKLPGVHFYDDSRYSGSVPRHMIAVLGANHNYYNKTWTSGYPGSRDEWRFWDPNDQDTHCGSGSGQRLSREQQRATGVAYVNAFFRTYAVSRAESSPGEFLGYLTGDIAPPPSVQGAKIYVSFHPQPGVNSRKDLNRLQTASELNVNTLGGSVVPVQLTPYTRCGGDAFDQHCLTSSIYTQPDWAKQPHTALSAPTSLPGLSQLNVGWSSQTASYKNELPMGQGNVSGYEALQFRVAVDMSRSPRFIDQDFRVVLKDTSSQTAVVRVSAAYLSRPNPLNFPPGQIVPEPIPARPVPHVLLNMVRIPLSKFTQNNPILNLSNLQWVEFNFDQTVPGALLFSDILFANTPNISFPPTFTPTLTPAPCVNQSYDYVGPTGGAFVPGGSAPVPGSQGNGVITEIELPFDYRLYDTVFDKNFNVTDDGTLQFSSKSTSKPDCVPNSDFSYTIFPQWEDLSTDTYNGLGGCPESDPCGVFTSISGNAPNRVFNIEWRACYLNGQKGKCQTDPYGNPIRLNFEVRLFENQTKFELVYDNVPHDIGQAAVGVQKDTNMYTQFRCDSQVGMNGQKLTFTLPAQCPPTPTRTNTPTNTPTYTPTATVCPSTSECGRFKDMLPTSPFFLHVKCLACNNVISGYDCTSIGQPCECGSPPNYLTYFLPNNDATRGQVAKILALSAKLPDVSIPQQFTDVIPGSVFYTYIQQLYHYGAVSGYACGGPGEPCDSESRPYFRPNQVATRGQYAKMASQTAGLTQYPAEPYFTDVPANQTFFEYIQRLKLRGYISGYNCGGLGEPCDSQERPYFRPDNKITRGQVAKIAAITFNSDLNCQLTAMPRPPKAPQVTETVPPSPPASPSATVPVSPSVPPLPSATTPPGSTATLPPPPSPIPSAPVPVPSAPAPLPTNYVPIPTATAARP